MDRRFGTVRVPRVFLKSRARAASTVERRARGASTVATRMATETNDADAREGKRARRAKCALDGVVDRRGTAVRVGDRLEVQWEVHAGDGSRSEDEDEDEEDANDGADDGDAGEGEGEDEGVGGEGEATLTWWPCSVATEGEDAFLLYDAGAGFDAEKRKVRFIDARTLTHGENDGGIFKWRREGDEEEEEGEEALDAPTTMREILAAQDAIDAENGESLENASMAAFATLPMNQQMNLASAFAGFKDKLLKRLSSLAQRKGENGVITKVDIDNIMSDIQKNA